MTPPSYTYSSVVALYLRIRIPSPAELDFVEHIYGFDDPEVEGLEEVDRRGVGGSYPCYDLRAGYLEYRRDV